MISIYSITQNVSKNHCASLLDWWIAIDVWQYFCNLTRTRSFGENRASFCFTSSRDFMCMIDFLRFTILHNGFPFLVEFYSYWTINTMNDRWMMSCDGCLKQQDIGGRMDKRIVPKFGEEEEFWPLLRIIHDKASVILLKATIDYPGLVVHLRIQGKCRERCPSMSEPVRWNVNYGFLFDDICS